MIDRMQESQRTDNATERNKDLCTGLWGDVGGKNSEHNIAKLEITSVKRGLCADKLQGEHKKKGNRVMIYFGWVRG